MSATEKCCGAKTSFPFYYCARLNRPARESTRSQYSLGYGAKTKVGVARSAAGSDLISDGGATSFALDVDLANLLLKVLHLVLPLTRFEEWQMLKKYETNPAGCC
jgi:hypothetical protein